MKLRALATLFVIAALPCAAQEFDKGKLDAFFDALSANNQFMGSVAISRGGEIIYTRSTGFTSVETGREADEHSIYRIGSISKTFTAVLALKAVEEKKLDLDATIDKFFPTVPNAARIKVRHLLSHRSGIHNITNDADYVTWHTQPKTADEMVGIIAKAGSDFEPDTKAAYSNSNFILLTYLLEKTFRKPYAELLTLYITKPLGLTNTAMGGKINPANNACASYRFDGKWVLTPETDMSIPMGAGAIVSTPSDLVRFGNALLGGKLLSSESLALMKTIKDGYGLGLIRFPFYDKFGYGHTGGIDGFSSMFGHFADGNVAFALTSNGTVYGTNDIAIALLSAAYGKPYEIPVFTTYQTTTEELDQYLGTYSSAQLPLKITVTKDKNNLVAQATGQSAFALEATARGKFRYIQAGIIMEFDPANKTMILKQGGGQFLFKRE